MCATETEVKAASIAHLDFRPSCTCITKTCPHPDQCGAEAAVILTFHDVDHCNDADCDRDGNVVGPMCQACLDHSTALVAAFVDGVQSVSRRTGGYAACRTCGCPVMHVSDVIRDVRPIR